MLPDQHGLAEEFKRLSDFLTQGGARDVRAKRGHDDRSRAVMLAVHEAFKSPPGDVEPMVEVISAPRFRRDEAAHYPGESEREANTHWFKL